MTEDLIMLHVSRMYKVSKIAKKPQDITVNLEVLKGKRVLAQLQFPYAQYERRNKQTNSEISGFFVTFQNVREKQ